MGTYISRVEIKNFRNFGHLVLDPFPARAVIVGENGVGKSNFLHALRLILDPALPDTARQLREEDLHEGCAASISSGVVITIGIEVRGYDDDDDAKSVLSSCSIQYDPYVAKMTYRFQPRPSVAIIDGEDRLIRIESSGRPFAIQDYEFVVYGGEDQANDIRRVRRDIAVRVLNALRDAEGDLKTWRRNPLRDLLERIPLDPANLKATASAVSTAVDQLRSDPNVSVLEQHLSTRLTSMTGPRLPVTPTLGFASSEPDELLRAVRLFVDANRKRQVGDASLGSANVLYLGLLLEALEQQRSDQDFITTILAVEEPEAHLHVSLQRRLFSYLLRSEPTLLLTTHSPHVAAVAPIDSLVILRETLNGTVGRTTASVPVNSRQRTDLERYLDISRAEILFATVVILVEGLAEAYIVPALATAAGFDLDSYGIVVASVHGTDFAPYVALLGPEGLDTPHIVITDGDARGNSVGRRQAGLRRACKLLPITEQTAFMEKIDALPLPDSLDYHRERQTLVDDLSSRGYFVGEQTLEVDLCTPFADAIKTAFGQLPSTAKGRAEIAEGVTNESSAKIDVDARDRMLKRIESVGKGRFAQRLASHLEDINLEEMVTLARRDSAPKLAADQVPYLGSASYLLRALHSVSLLSRGAPLIADDDPLGELEV